MALLVKTSSKPPCQGGGGESGGPGSALGMQRGLCSFQWALW